ncbi:hypothetical protein N7462_003565 [Penicillium macrosclerotiorum]|uniref:uncharacterized protein n=1 Tax=Penicillium macrosclerotiorum TaxID=303699 RepID=UPI002548148F|nr:uncharacterized protein N7462_003565 [Penicillium macrosclerotiorum]KAJ5689173.1 hypothetical protein N7462_003565 [Penicillium macrosclerotiorum]
MLNITSAMESSVLSLTQSAQSHNPPEETLFNLSGLPPELILEIAKNLDDRSLANMVQSCRDFQWLLTLDLQKRARLAALAPRDLYEENYVYNDDDHPGIDEPVLRLGRTISVPRRGFGPLATELLGRGIVFRNLHTVRFFLQSGISANAYTVCGMRMLTLAVESSYMPMIDLLLEFKADASLLDLIVQRNPLAHAAAAGNDECVQRFIRAGADVNHRAVMQLMARFCTLQTLAMAATTGADFASARCLEHDVCGMTILHNVVERRDPQVLAWIMPRLPTGLINSLNSLGHTALHMAVLSQTPQLLVAPFLCSQDVDLNIQDVTGYTALHRAIERGHFDTAQLLLQKGARVNLTTSDGETELHLAVVMGDYDIVRSLLQRGADINAFRPVTGTPLHYAMQRRNTILIAILLRESLMAPNLGLRDMHGRTTHQLALTYQQPDLLSLFF